jgi:hypothetical protein
MPRPRRAPRPRPRPKLAGYVVKGKYVRFDLRPHGLVFLHRLVAAEALGRELRPDEHVHHRDGNGFHNDPRNLEVIPAGEHSRLTALKTPLLSACEQCGKVFWRRQKTRNLQVKTCSPACGWLWRSARYYARLGRTAKGEQ